MSIFFVSCPVNFESELVQELESFWFNMIDLDGLPTRDPAPEFKIETGGIELNTPLHLGLQINFFSKIALRVLMRVESFEARYFDQFEKGMNKFNLEKFIEPQNINIQIESIKSRLFHEGNLLESCTKVMSTKNFKYSKESSMCLLLRLVKDKVTISLDTSGQHLHFRGYRKFQGEAPIRENLAALILKMGQINSFENEFIFDPYCGSGTMLFETQLQNFPNFSRDFSFLNFKITPAIFKSESWKKNFRWIKAKTNFEYIGIEKNEDTYLKSQKNADVFKTNFCDMKLNLLNEDCEKIDLKKIESITKEKKITLITNTPYGERSAAGNVEKNIQRFEGLKGLIKVVVIHPDNWKFHFKKLILKKSVLFSNQGLKTKVSVFEI